MNINDSKLIKNQSKNKLNLPNIEKLLQYELNKSNNN